MSATPSEPVCPHCGATYAQRSQTCWLCKRDMPAETVGHVASVQPPQNLALTFTIASVLLTTTLIAVCFAVLMIAPGLGIGLAILSVPAFVRTGLVTRRRSQLGMPVSPTLKVLWFLGSVATTTIVVTVVVVASVGTFCAVCLSAGTESAIPFALFVAAVVTMGVLVASGTWIRRRWRRDVGSS